MVNKQIRVSDGLYAGSRGCFESPASSSVPLPAFLGKNGAATIDLRRLLSLILDDHHELEQSKMAEGFVGFLDGNGRIRTGFLFQRCQVLQALTVGPKSKFIWVSLDGTCQVGAYFYIAPEIEQGWQ